MLRDLSLLQDILEACALIEEYMTDVSYDEFDASYARQDSVIRRIAIIGEAANHLSKGFKANLPDIPWRDIVDMRNILIHAYNDIITEEVWQVATRDTPALAKRLKPFLDEMSTGSL